VKYKYISTLLTLTILLPLTSRASFSDTTNHPYQESINNLQQRSIIQGYPDGSFKPDNPVSRAEMLKIVLGSYPINQQSEPKTNCFPDVTDQRYAPYVCYALEQDIIQGYPDGTFKPDNPVSIAEWSKIALETFQIKLKQEEKSRRYESYIEFIHNNNIFSKYASYPDEFMTRAHMSYMIHQLILDLEGDKKLDSKRSNPSLGCLRKSPPSTPPSVSQINNTERSYITSIGNKYNHNKPTKLIFAFHGRTNSNAQVRDYYDIEKVRNQDGIIVYPAALPAGNTFSRNTTIDIEFFDQLVEDFTRNYCIDLDEIYVLGHSLGAWFTNTLACARGDIIRAIGSVGGSITKLNACSWPVASIIMHNPNDRLASFAGGEYARNILLEANQCDPNQSKPTWPIDGNCLEYTQCLDDNPVIWCPHTQDYARRDGSYYPHTRPDFAAKEIRNFFHHLE
jgi:polyhydroxybutyrate depolymerase